MAGGGIDRSTGDGVSPGISPGLGPGPLRRPPLARGAFAFATAGNSGVELALFVPRRLLRLLPLALLPSEGTFCGMRFTAGRLRDGRPLPFSSSLPGDTVRRFVPVDEPGCCMERGVLADDGFVLYAPSHGLVSGDISSKSRSAGDCIGYGLCMFWNTILAGAEWGAGGITCCWTKD